MKTALTLFMMVCGNVFMTTAWYWHLRHGGTSGKALPLIILTSWLIAFFEYCIMVPANRIGMFSAGFTVAQLKVIQEVVTMGIFAVFCITYMRQELSWDYLWASLCLVAAAFFMFRHLPG